MKKQKQLLNYSEIRHITLPMFLFWIFSLIIIFFFNDKSSIFDGKTPGQFYQTIKNYEKVQQNRLIKWSTDRVVKFCC